MKKNDTLGFTLMELIITIAIMTIISGVVFFSFPRFNQTVLLNRAARELTLALREAQSRATAVAQRPDAESGAEFPKNYGIRVEQDSEVFFLFSDEDEDRLLDMSSDCNEECVKRYEFTYGVRIKNIQLPESVSLSDDGQLNILFYRPDPTMKISGCVGESNLCNTIGPYKISIYRAGQDENDTRTIQVWTTGQISISNP